MGPVLGVGGFLEARARSLQGNPRPTSPGRAGPVRSSVAAPDCCGGLGNLDFTVEALRINTKTDKADPRGTQPGRGSGEKELGWGSGGKRCCGEERMEWLE